MSMSERIAMFNKSKAAPQVAAQSNPAPIKEETAKDDNQKPNCRESFLKLASQEKKSINPAFTKNDSRKKTENEVKAINPIEEKEINAHQKRDQEIVKPDHNHIEKQLHLNNEAASCTANEDKANIKSKEFKKGLTMVGKGKSEKVFGMANQMENRFKMMGMMGGPKPQKVKPVEEENIEEAEQKEAEEETSPDFFKKKGRSHSLKGDKQLSNFIELSVNQIEIMNMKPSVLKKKKTVKPTFQDRQSIVHID